MHAFLSLSFSNFHKIEYSFMFCFECVCVYQMSLFRMPKSVARRLEKLQRDFLWGGRNLERKAHLVKWEVVCGDKEKGGLGIRKLTLLIKALLGKWIWRFACDYLEASAYGEVWVRGFWMEDKKGCGCVWSGGLEGDFEGSWMVLGKIGV